MQVTFIITPALDKIKRYKYIIFNKNNKNMKKALKIAKWILSAPFFVVGYVAIALGIIVLGIAYTIKDFTMVKTLIIEFYKKLKEPK